MGYSEKRKMGRRRVEAAAGIIGRLEQRVALMESVVSQVLQRDGLSVGFSKEQGIVLVPTPTTPPQPDLDVKVVDEEPTKPEWEQ